MVDTVPLFTPYTLREVSLANRVVVAPMCQYACKDGEANDWHLMHLGQYAMGAAALVFTEATHVSAVGRISNHCLGLYTDAQEKALLKVFDFCRQYGVVKLAIQLGHAGRKASTFPPGQGAGPLGPNDNAWQTVAPSAVPHDDGWHCPEALDAGGIAEIRNQFVESAKRAARIGTDVLELHSAHGYLLHQFLSPLSNRRTDAYGGSLENRMRMTLETFEAMRAVWPQERPLGVRVSATDWVDGGWTVDETVTLSRELKALGCDFIDVSSGGLSPKQQIPLGPGYQVHFATRIKQEAGIPVMAVGMITEPAQANAIVAEDKAEMVALARGMMYDPRWAWHAAETLGAETPYAKQYERCHPSRWPQAFAHRRAAE